MKSRWVAGLVAGVIVFLSPARPVCAADIEPIAVEAQPLAANVNRLLEALSMLGAPLPKETADRLAQAGKGRDAGLASGMINTSQQIGGAIGTAVVSSVSTGHTSALVTRSASRVVALTGGYSWGFWVGASVGLTGVAATLALIPRRLPARAAEVEA